MALHPPKTKVVVIPLEPPEHSIGGIYLPEHRKRRPVTGVVIYRGPLTTEVHVGDHVIFSGFVGDKVTIAGEGSFIIMYEEDILAIVTEEPYEPLIPLSTCKRLINERLDEVKKRLGDKYPDVARFGEDLYDRLRDLPQTEGMEF